MSRRRVVPRLCGCGTRIRTWRPVCARCNRKQPVTCGHFQRHETRVVSAEGTVITTDCRLCGERLSVRPIAPRSGPPGGERRLA
jgi:transcription elongation factor Elf1